MSSSVIIKPKETRPKYVLQENQTFLAGFENKEDAIRVAKQLHRTGSFYFRCYHEVYELRGDKYIGIFQLKPFEEVKNSK
uniref:Uncharacterized protein n=1 Tax=viral metagenome TaxID=1070528 RepID=A0A6M3JBZ8_9ZZZZ